MKHTKKTKAAVAPDWLETPEPRRYSLSMDDQSENLQHVGLTREEFIGLKHHLAGTRNQAKRPA